MVPKKIRTVVRDAIDGRFVKKDQALIRPHETVTETVKILKKRKR